jgi:hypothetical protein
MVGKIAWMQLEDIPVASRPAKVQMALGRLYLQQGNKAYVSALSLHGEHLVYPPVPVLFTI